MEINHQLILDMDTECLEKDYDESFKKEYGIISMIPTGYHINGTEEHILSFSSQERMINYIKEFDIDC